MIELSVELPSTTDRTNLPARIERLCGEAGLTLSLLGTLKTYPGSMHWHFTKGASRGMLEITWIADSGRLWLSMQSGRAAPWIEPVMARLKSALVTNATP